MAYNTSHLVTAGFAGLAAGVSLFHLYTTSKQQQNASATTSSNTASARKGSSKQLQATVGHSALHHNQPLTSAATQHATTPRDYQLETANWTQQYDYMCDLYPVLIDDFIQWVQNEHQLPKHAVERLRKLCDYTIKGGKYNRALLVTNSVKVLCREAGVDSKPYATKAVVLGWCIEILQALFLVADDMMDGSITRRGKPCWYKLPDVQYDAVNDTLILEALMYFLLNQYFEGTAEHVALTELFQEVTLNTEMGQMVDLLSQPQGRKGNDILHSFNSELYHKIVKYKTCLYSFYLPIAAALILFNVPNLQKALDAARLLSIELGTKFQIQDDYLDAYADPEILGKVGTDIRDHKCSWMVVQVLERANKEQMKTLEANYGKEEGEPAIKKLYEELNLPQIYEQQEQQSYEKIQQMIKQYQSLLPEEISQEILDRIHKRQK